jgi:hypothetical protein
VLAAAKTISTGAIAKRLAAFSSAHRAYVAAQAKVDAADRKLRAAQAVVGERDVEQDEAVLALASTLAGLGMSRTNPFRPLGFEAPSRLVKLGYGVEAKRVLALVKAIGKHEDVAKGASAACRRAAAGARSVQAALARIPAVQRAYAEALTARDALAQPWETSFSALKRAARYADDDGGSALFATLFERTAPPKKRVTRAAGTPTAPAATGTGG